MLRIFTAVRSKNVGGTVSKSNSILLLRVTAMVMTFLSIAVLAESIVGRYTLVAGGFPIPMWLFGAAGLVCGIRNWLRIKKIEQQVGM